MFISKADIYLLVPRWAVDGETYKSRTMISHKYSYLLTYLLTYN